MTKTKLTVARLIVAAILIVSLLASVTLAFAEEAAEPQTRAFDERFDRMLDNASGTDGVLPAYSHVVWQAGQASTVTDPIFKMGHAKMEGDANPTSLTLTVRSSVTKVADLRLALRLKGVDSDDACAIIDLSDPNYPVEFSQGDDIGEEWTDMTFDFSQWDDIEFNDANHTKFSDEGVCISGFHLFSDSAKGGELDIQQISFTGTVTSVLYNFDDITEGAYWPQSAAGLATNYGRHYAITDSKQIASEVATSNNADGAYSAIVLSVSGDAQFTVAPVKADGTVGAAKAWAELTDLASTSLPALSDKVQNVVVSLDSLGEKAIRGVQFDVTSGTLNVYGAFFTNLEMPALGEVPRLDVNSIAYMTQFNFEYVKFTNQYEQGVEDGAPFNLAYIISYGGQESVRVTNGHLVFEPTDYANAKLRSNVSSEGRRYVVIKYKVSGGTMDNFRFGVIDTEKDVAATPAWYHDLKVAEGRLSKETPYMSESGYGYLVVDVQLQFGVSEFSGIDLYYQGAGTLYIDEIIYANEIVPEKSLSDNILTEDRVVTIPAGSDYAYVTGFDLDGKSHDGIAITMKATEGATLTPARLEFVGANATRWFRPNEAGMLYDVYGNELPDITTEEQTYYIDYAKSGVSGAITNLHFHTEKLASEVTYTITSIQYVDYVENLETTAEVLAEDFAGKEFTAPDAGFEYQYIGWASGEARTGMDYMILEVEGDISQLRIEMGSVIWFAENPAGSFVGKDGNRFDLTETGKRTLVIDLALSNVPETVTDIHFHNGFTQAGEVIRITSLKFAKRVVVPYEDIVAAMPVNDDAKPTVDSFELPETGTVGTEITVTATASDNYSAASALQTTITVTREGTAVAVSGNKFTPDQSGTYTVTVTVRDEAGNEISESKTITVTAQSSDPTDDPTDDPNKDPVKPDESTTTDKDGLPGWAIALIVIGAILLVGGAVACVLIIKKKKSK